VNEPRDDTALPRRAVVLAGGLGTRLRPYTTVLPKPLMPIGDRPVLDVVIRQLKHYGFDRITISTGHLAELIEAFFGNGDAYGIPIDYFREHEPLGTVGSLALIEGLDSDSFLVINGDVLTDLDHGSLLAEHRSSGAAATIATTRRHVEISLGVLERGSEDDGARVIAYHEKPAIDYEASMGVYCFSPGAIGHIERGEHLDFPDLVVRLIEADEQVHARLYDGFWLDIGRPDDYERATEEFERQRARLLPGE
jgi:NDP-mannose synthase